jgi:hypothetical protein
MSVIPESAAVTADVVKDNQPAAEAESSGTAILITEQEVLLGTAVAVPVPRETVGRRFMDVLRSAFLDTRADARPRRTYYTPYLDFIADARMAREMHRL